MPSRHAIPQDLYNPCLSLIDYARTMLTPTMFSRRRVADFSRARGARDEGDMNLYVLYVVSLDIFKRRGI